MKTWSWRGSRPCYVSSSISLHRLFSEVVPYWAGSSPIVWIGRSVSWLTPCPVLRIECIGTEYHVCFFLNMGIDDQELGPYIWTASTLTSKPFTQLPPFCYFIYTSIPFKISISSLHIQCSLIQISTFLIQQWNNCYHF